MNAEYIRQKLLKEATPQERRLYAILDELNVEYIPQWVVPYGDSWMFCDAWLPNHNIVIEADGMHHIFELDRNADDNARDLYLKQVHDIKVVRYLNSTIMDRSFIKIIKGLVNPIRQTKLG